MAENAVATLETPMQGEVIILIIMLATLISVLVMIKLG